MTPHVTRVLLRPFQRSCAGTRRQNWRQPLWAGALAVLLLHQTTGFSQGSAGTEGGAEPRYLVDIPTAGMLGKGSLALDVDFFREGGVLLGVSYAFLGRFSLGVSYGGSQLIGDDKAIFNPVPGLNARIRPFEEGATLPAILLGFDSQGKEGYNKELDRYTIRSKGLFAVASKNFDFAGFLSIHGGVNYSLEGNKDERGVDFFAGIEKTIGPTISVVLEFDGDRNKKSSGYLNVGFRWSVGGGFTLGVDLKDLTKNDEKVTIGNRSVKIEFLRVL